MIRIRIRVDCLAGTCVIQLSNHGENVSAELISAASTSANSHWYVYFSLYTDQSFWVSASFSGSKKR